MLCYYVNNSGVIMLSALKGKAKELVSTVTHGQGVSKSIDKENLLPENALNPSYPYANFGYMENGVFYRSNLAIENKANLNISGISGIPDEEAWEWFRKHMIGKSHVGGDYYKNHMNTLLEGEVPKKVVEELYNIKSDKIKFAALEEFLDEENRSFPVARLAIAGKDQVCLMDFLEANKCKEYGVNAITMCSPDENKTRGVRLTLCYDEDGQEIKSYEILNGTYDMDLTWEVEGKKCEMKISVSSDGSAKILKRNGVTDEEIYAHTEVMVGKEHDTKSLYEALGLQQTQGKNVEKIQPKLYKRSQPQKSKEIKELVEKNPEVKSALKEFASEVKEESSESVKPLTDITKANVKEAGSSIQR